MSEQNYLISDIRFLLPLKTGETVVVFGEVPELIDMIHTSKIKCINIVEHDRDRKINTQIDRFIWRIDDRKLKQSLGLPGGSVDHILIPFCSFHKPEWVFNEITRVLKQDGQLFLGVKTQKNWLNHFAQLGKFWSRPNLPPLQTLESILQILEKNQFNIRNCYGIYKSLNDPRYMIPLEESGPTQYFFDHILTPFSWRGRIEYSIAANIARRLGQYSMFQNIGLLAQKK